MDKIRMMIIFTIIQLLIVFFIFLKERKQYVYKNGIKGVKMVDIFMPLFFVNLYVLFPFFTYDYFGYGISNIISQVHYIIAFLYIIYILFIKYRQGIKNVLLGDKLNLPNLIWFIKFILVLTIIYILPAGLIIKYFGLPYYFDKITSNVQWFHILKYIHLHYRYAILPTILFSLIIGPIVEELLYRRMLYLYLKKLFNIKIAFILALILFYLLHHSFFNIKVLIWGSFYLWIYERTKTLLYCILVHSISNLKLNIDYLLWTKQDVFNHENILIFVGIIAICAFFSITIFERKIGSGHLDKIVTAAI